MPKKPKPNTDWLTSKDIPYTPEYLSELEYWLAQ